MATTVNTLQLGIPSARVNIYNNGNKDVSVRQLKNGENYQLLECRSHVAMEAARGVHGNDNKQLETRCSHMVLNYRNSVLGCW